MIFWFYIIKFDFFNKKRELYTQEFDKSLFVPFLPE